jgi:hypothetical protein
VIDERKKKVYLIPVIQNFYLLHSANRFVISKDKEYLELLVNEYSRFQKNGNLNEVLSHLWVL